MSRTRRLIDGLGLGYVYLGLVTIVGLWLTPFLLGHVGQRDLGLWLVANQVLGYLALLDVGVVALLPRETAYATGRAGSAVSPELVALLARVKQIVRWQLPLVGLASTVVWVALPTEWSELRGPLAVVLAAFTALFPSRLYHSLLQGLQELRFLGQVQLAVWVASTGATIGLVLTGWHLDALVASWVVLQAATSVACMWRVRSQYPELWQASVGHVGWPVVKDYLRRSVWVSAAQLSQVLLAGTDVLVIGRLLGPLAVVPYACTSKLVTVLANHPQLLMQAAAPALSEMRAAGERDRLRQVSMVLARVMLLASGAVACGVVAINRPFVTWWVGPDQYGGWALTGAVVISMLARHWNTSLVYSLFCFGYERRLSLTTLADGGVTIVASVMLVYAVGPVGAPLGSLIGAMLISLPFNHLALGRELGTTSWQLVAAQVPLFLRLAAVGLAAVGLAPRLPATVGGAVLGGVLMAGGYALVMAPLLFRPPLREYVMRFAGPWLPGAKAAGAHLT